MKANKIKIIAVANQKGGVGKTTTTLNLGAAFSILKYKTLVLDLDPHASVTVHLAYYPENVKKSSLDLFKTGFDPKEWSSLIRKENRHNFDFVPGSIKLSDLDGDLHEKKGKGRILQNRLQEVAKDYEYIILDCPPQLGVLLVNALVCSDLTIIPIQTEFLALHGLRLIFDTIKMLNKALPSPIYYKALATMYDKRISACSRVYNVLEKKLGERMFQTVINTETKFREASAKGTVIFQVSLKTRGSKEHLQLAKEIEQL